MVNERLLGIFINTYSNGAEGLSSAKIGADQLEELAEKLQSAAEEVRKSNTPVRIKVVRFKERKSERSPQAALFVESVKAENTI